MSRTARIIHAGQSYHVIQRGNRRQKTFFRQDDRRFYLHLLRRQCQEHAIAILAYCLMPNHVHLVVVPSAPKLLALAIGNTHKYYTDRINKREKWRGYLWQGRFLSYEIDPDAIPVVIRYVEINPVKAGLSTIAADYPWSSARAHCRQYLNNLLSPCPALDKIPDWSNFLQDDLRAEQSLEPLRLTMPSTLMNQKKFNDLITQKFGIGE